MRYASAQMVGRADLSAGEADALERLPRSSNTPLINAHRVLVRYVSAW